MGANHSLFTPPLILDRDKFACTLCRDEKSTLHVHHKKYTGQPWEALDEDLETICLDCHGLIEWMKKAKMWEVDYIKSIVKRSTGYSFKFYCFMVVDDYDIFEYSIDSLDYYQTNNITGTDLKLLLNHFNSVNNG